MTNARAVVTSYDQRARDQVTCVFNYLISGSIVARAMVIVPGTSVADPRRRRLGATVEYRDIAPLAGALVKTLMTPTPNRFRRGRQELDRDESGRDARDQRASRVF